ncbi:MAG: ABC transporter permease subunit [Pseudomonadales bacterium]
MAESIITPLSSEAFQRLEATQQTQGISRPSLSYWQDAWIRLKSNGRAIASLWIIIGLLAFTLVGPFLWQVDPAAQDVSQISQPPLANRNATLVEPFESWQVDALAPPVSGIELTEPATTQFVRLIWATMPEVDGYRVYRNIYPATEGVPLGLPLGEILFADQFHFEDRLDLEAETYYYSVVGFDAAGEKRETVQSIEVKPETVITIAEARQRGLVSGNAPLEIGDNISQALHPLGTDYLGRDMLARLMQGARVSLFIGIVAPLLFVAFGVLYGSIAGFMGGVTDQVLMRFADFVVALPFLLFMILFKIAFGIGPGESGIFPMLIALVLLSWPATARLVRGQILQIREEGYISAAQLLGARTNYLVLRHMIPNTMGVILVTLTFAVPSAIFTEAFLSFIGMGVAPPTPSWGSMSNEGIKTMLSHPHELIFPALLISITVLAFNLLGDGLRDALDARMRSRE